MTRIPGSVPGVVPVASKQLVENNDDNTESETSNAADPVTVELPPGCPPIAELAAAEVERQIAAGNEPRTTRERWEKWLVENAAQRLVDDWVARQQPRQHRPKWPAWLPGYLLDAVTHPDGQMDSRWRDRYEYGPHANPSPHVRAANQAKHALFRRKADGERITEEIVLAELHTAHGTRYTEPEPERFDPYQPTADELAAEADADAAAERWFADLEAQGLHPTDLIRNL